MKKYSKREFLKIVGLSIAIAPFYTILSSCSNESKSKEADKDNSLEIEDDPDLSNNSKATFKISDEDVIVLEKEAADFDKFKMGFNARIKKLPKYIAICKTTLGVQYAINLGKKEGLKITVKSGGHSFEGFSSNDDGLMINLSQMKKIIWEEGNKVQIEAGSLLQEVQDELFSKQRLIPTGSCGTVGIAGLALGGGYGFFSRKYGLTCDSLTEVEFVDGQGNIHMASKDKNLFWALKGGGNGSFGVATKFTFETQAMPQNFFAHVMKFRNLNSQTFFSVLNTWFDTSGKMTEDDFSAFVLNGTTLTILNTTIGNRNLLKNNIAELEDMATSKHSSDVALPKAMKRYYGRTGPIYFKNASAGLYHSFKDIESIAEQIFEKVANSKGLIFQINTLGANINNAAFEQNSCYPHRGIPYLSELQAYYESSDQEKRLLNLFEEVQDLIRGVGITAQYRNYPDVNFPNWQQAYYGANYSVLQKIKSKFDTDNLFQYPQSIELL